MQIGDVLNWIASPQFVLGHWSPWRCAGSMRAFLALGFVPIAIGSRMDTGMTHDCADDDFLRSQIVEAYIDGFWLVAWVLAASLLLTVLSPPPPNPLTPPRLDT